MAGVPPAIEERLAGQGLTLLFAVPWPGQSLYTQEPVESVSDLEGTAFRAYNAATERLATLMGAVPTQIETGDIPTAFATGRADAMITSPSTGVSSQAWDFVSTYTELEAWLPKNMVIVNTSAFEGLPEEVQSAVMEAADAAGADRSLTGRTGEFPLSRRGVSRARRHLRPRRPRAGVASDQCAAGAVQPRVVGRGGGGGGGPVAVRDVVELAADGGQLGLRQRQLRNVAYRSGCPKA